MMEASSTGTGGIITRKNEKGAPLYRTEVNVGVSTEHLKDSEQ
ncbi:MAG TPA: hypothetical protein VFN01_13510 [Marinobacter sp.]|nr:hypothetical protein [Marinobacter sp.]HET8802185.1 hypothetical protein [Marinobacter sp.]